MLTRALIVLLLVLNLGVAAWWWLRPPPPVSPPPAQPAGVPLLRLVGEAAPPSAAPTASSPAPAPTSRPAQPSTQASEPAPAPSPQAETAQRPATAPADVPAAAADAPSATPQRCFAFGPFNDRAAAEAARAALQPQAARLRLRSEPAPARRRYWDVRLPPQADRAAAQALAQRLEAAGFHDYYVIGQGEGANGIALGRFGSEQPARRHQAALQAAGFAAQIEGPPSAERFWLDVAVGAAFDPEAARRAAAAPRAQPAECAAPG